MGRNSLADKLKYIQLIEHGLSARQIQNQYGVKDDQIRQWVKRYRAEVPDGLKRRRVHQYSPEFKQQVVDLYLAGNTSYPQLASQFEIPNSSIIYQWVKLYTSGKSLKTTRRSHLMKNGRKTTQLERIEIAQWAIANDLDYNGATKKFEVSYGQVYAWVKKFKQDGPEALQDRRGKDKASKPNLTDEEKQVLKIKELEARNAYLFKGE